MNDKNTGSSGGYGLSFTTVLTIVFIVLKLCGVIDWSWVWVLAPMWISFVLWILIIAVIGFVLKSKIRRKEKKR